jgi:hypothetical protein
VVIESTVDEVLSQRSLSSLEAYYDLLLSDGDKDWDERRRWGSNHR